MTLLWQYLGGEDLALAVATGRELGILREVAELTSKVKTNGKTQVEVIIMEVFIRGFTF